MPKEERELSIQFFAIALLALTGAVLALAMYSRGGKNQKSPIESIDPWPFVKADRLFNPPEYNFYRAMLQYMPPEVIVFPKVRLQNIVYVSPDSKLYDHFAARVGRKYVDFLICRIEDMRIVCAVEFDDNAVDADKTREKAHDLNRILDGAGLEVFHYSEHFEYTEADFQPINDYIAGGRY